MRGGRGWKVTDKERGELGRRRRSDLKGRRSRFNSTLEEVAED